MTKAEAVAIVYIDRYYDDAPDEPQPWPRSRRSLPGDAEWTAVCDGPGDHVERSEFDSADDAIAWGRARSERVLVRLGVTEDEIYTVGDFRLTTRIDGTGRPYLEWPPDNWPDYRGPGAERRRF